MEIASTDKLAYRKATRADAGRISSLMKVAEYHHLHTDWHYPAEWLDRPGFWICEGATLGKEREIIACFGAAADPLPAAWVRLAAARTKIRPEHVLGKLLEQVVPELATGGVTELGWLLAEPWPDAWLVNLGFSRVNWILSYVKYGVDSAVASPIDVTVRKARFGDIDDMVAIEKGAFEPLWRHSAESFELAFGQAICFDVALREGRPVGFHYSARGMDDDSAHLVRITVLPEEQGHGVGTALMTRAMDTYGRLGITRITLNTQLDNLASHRLYERFGFRRLGDRLPLWVMEIGTED